MVAQKVSEGVREGVSEGLKGRVTWLSSENGAKLATTHLIVNQTGLMQRYNGNVIDRRDIQEQKRRL